MAKNRTIINYRHKRRKFQLALLLYLYLCHMLSIAHGGELGGREQSPSFDLTTAKIREPKDVAPPASLQDLKNLHEDSDDEDEDDDDDADDGGLDLKSSRKYNISTTLPPFTHKHTRFPLQPCHVLVHGELKNVSLISHLFLIGSDLAVMVFNALYMSKWYMYACWEADVDAV